MSIERFNGSNRYLSNFYMCEVAYDGMLYPSSEHAFQAAKSLSLPVRQRIARAPTAAEAKHRGREAVLRADWETAKIHIMWVVVLDKFLRNPPLAQRLRTTGDVQLIEGNSWGDTFWGVCGGVGENMLGLTLMRVRAFLHNDTCIFEAP